MSDVTEVNGPTEEQLEHTELSVYVTGTGYICCEWPDPEIYLSPAEARDFVTALQDMISQAEGRPVSPAESLPASVLN